MVWLVSHMWIALALAAVFGLSFGWAIRGLSLKAVARDALVARDVALTELSHSKLEIDQLYAAQSKGLDAATEAGDEALRAELEARETRLSTLANELAGSQAELEALRERAISGAGADANAGTPHSPERLDANISPANAAMEWRNRYLESRVRSLETRNEGQPAEPDTGAETGVAIETEALQADLEAARMRAEIAEADAESAHAASRDAEARITTLEASASAAAVAGVAVAATQDDTPSEETARVDTALADKAAWQTKYLRQRLAYIESHGFTPRPPAGPVATEVAQAEAPLVLTEEVKSSDTAAPTTEEASDGELEQELARLRWRNRYLEGRLAYIDGDAPKSDAELAEDEKLASALEENAPENTTEIETAPSVVEDEMVAPDDSDAATSPEAVAAGIASLRASFGQEDEPDEGPPDLVVAEMAAPNEDFDTVDFAEVEAETEAPVVETAPDDDSELVINAPETGEAATSLTDFANTALSETSFASPADTFLATLESGGDLLKPAMVPIPADGGDDLTRIEGIGGQTSEMLQDLGIWLYSQIADWSAQNIAWVNQHFNSEDRVESERWLEQATELSQSANAGTV